MADERHVTDLLGTIGGVERGSSGTLSGLLRRHRAASS
jgi:hypothetical protein